MGNGKWEILKFELRKKSIAFSKALAIKKKTKKELAVLLPKIINLEQDIDGEENNLMNMIKLKTKFIIYDNIY